MSVCWKSCTGTVAARGWELEERERERKRARKRARACVGHNKRETKFSETFVNKNLNIIAEIMLYLYVDLIFFFYP